jgi:hypothetical protein
MSSCEKHIISNSTFSWWAAWLNNRSSRHVIAPKVTEWFHGEYAHMHAGDIVLPGWQQISNKD